MRPLALAALPLALACSAVCAQTTTPADPPRCEIIMGVVLENIPPEDCPDVHREFPLVQDVDVAVLTWVSENEAIAVRPYCTPSEGGTYCEAWPQEYVSLGKLSYVWHIQTATASEEYSGTNPGYAFSCEAQQPVTATLTVINGTYQGTQSVTFDCGSASE